MPERSPDIVVPSRLLHQLGMDHSVVTAASGSEEIFHEFAGIYRSNVSFAHEIWLPDALAIFQRFGLAKAAVTGSGSEVGRRYYGLASIADVEVTPAHVAALARMDGSDYATEFFGKWLSGIGNTFNLNVLDLFYWEQRVGNWLAMCQSEFDVAWQEIFTPFNCRRLLVTLLSVGEEYRRAPNYQLYKEVILNLWPEVLSVPINPQMRRPPLQVLKSSRLGKAVRPLVKRFL